MFAIHRTDCQIPNQIFASILAGAIFSLLAALASGLLTTTQSAGAVTFVVLFSLLGLVGMLKDISILRCPNRVLVGAAVFITCTAVLDSYVF